MKDKTDEVSRGVNSEGRSGVDRAMACLILFAVLVLIVLSIFTYQIYKADIVNAANIVELTTKERPTVPKGAVDLQGIVEPSYVKSRVVGNIAHTGMSRKLIVNGKADAYVINLEFPAETIKTFTCDADYTEFVVDKDIINERLEVRDVYNKDKRLIKQTACIYLRDDDLIPEETIYGLQERIHISNNPDFIPAYCDLGKVVGGDIVSDDGLYLVPKLNSEGIDEYVTLFDKIGLDSVDEDM